MKIDYPMEEQYPQLVCLWQEAFGDTEEFIDGFWGTAFAPSRCRCVTMGREVAAALYWLDVTCEGRRFAYIYAMAVAKKYRGRGLCAALMADTHSQLKLRGHAGVLLVPQDEGLRQMYGKMGYKTCSRVAEFSALPGDAPLPLQRIDRDTYARLRREWLPRGGVWQEGENIAFLETMAFFYRGEHVLLAAHGEGGKLWVPELLGDASAAPGILAQLRCSQGRFRTPGDTFPFAMCLLLEKDAPTPAYFGLAFD